MKSATSKRFTWPVSVWLLLTIPACMFSAKQQKRLFRKAEKKQYDVIIVPGVPFENGRWDRIMKGRVYWSKYLYDKGIAKNIMYSGGAVYTPYYEGKIMALYAEAIGIPPAHIFTETNAEHSTENIYYSYRKARKLGFTSIALASDPFQTRMLRKYTRRKVSDSVAIIPFVVDTLKLAEPGMIDPPIDFEQAFKKDFISIKKRESFRKRWRGTRGKNVEEKNDE
jgi:uncharacterized SAM-binding protein YcdF (DUF218 family)